MELWTYDDLASYLRVTVRTAKRWVSDHEIPARRIGRTVRFDPKEIKRWVDKCSVPAKPFSREHSHVYFAKDPLTGLVKIGVSYQVPARVSQLSAQIGRKLVLLGTIPGSRRTEMAVHERFVDRQVDSDDLPTTEWFEYCAEMDAMLDGEHE